MRRNIKSVAALVLTASVLMGGTLTAEASGLMAVGDTTTATSDLALAVSEDELTNITVSIPESTTLTWNEEEEAYLADDIVSAYGRLRSSMKLEIKAKSLMLFTNSEAGSSANMVGNVDFGEDNTQYWTSEQLRAGYDDIANVDERAINYAVTDNSNASIGSYTGVTDFILTLVYNDAIQFGDAEDDSGVYYGNTFFEFSDASLFVSEFERYKDLTRISAVDALPNYVAATGDTTLVVPALENTDYSNIPVLCAYDSNPTDYSGIETVVFSSEFLYLSHRAFDNDWVTNVSGITTLYVPNIPVEGSVFDSLTGLTDVYYAGTEAQFITNVTTNVTGELYSLGLSENAPLYNATLHLLDENREWYVYDWTDFIASYNPDM